MQKTKQWLETITVEQRAMIRTLHDFWHADSESKHIQDVEKITFDAFFKDRAHESEYMNIYDLHQLMTTGSIEDQGDE